MPSDSETAEPLEEDPLKLRSGFIFRCFDGYLRWYFRRNFHAVRISRAGQPMLPPGRPAVIYTNHPSWWDPAFFIVLSGIKFPERISFGPMDAAALEKYPFFKRVGIFGIEPTTARGAQRFLIASLRILRDPRAMLWVTSEGEFTDARQRPVRLRPGIAHLARRLQNAVFVPLAMEFPFWNERYPEALARFGSPLAVDSMGERTVADWTRLFEERLAQTMDGLADDAISRDPTRFEVLIDGSVGVGGVYDLWRRLKAGLRRERFSAQHDETTT